MGSRQLTAVAALAVLIVGGAWLVRDFRQRQTAPHVDADAVVRLFKTPEDLPEFTMTDLAGKTYSSADWRGKVVLINFWATWCPPCRAEIPDLVALQNKYRDNLVIVGVSEDEIPVADVKRFADGQGMNYPIVMTTPEIRKIFRGVAALPTTFVIDRDGKLQQRHVGQLHPAGIDAETRVLAGLETNAKVERVENSEKARIESAAEAKSIPGIDLSRFNDTQRKAVVQALLTEDCTCGCGLTLAVCRLDDPTCPVSLPMAQEIAKKYSATP